MFQGGLEVDAMVDAAPESELIGIFEFVPDGDSARDDRDLHSRILEHAIDVEVGRVSLHRGTQSEEYLLDALTAHTFGEVLEIEVGRTYAVKGGDDPPRT